MPSTLDFHERTWQLPRTPHPLAPEALAALERGRLLYSPSSRDIAEFIARHPGVADIAVRDTLWWAGTLYETIQIVASDDLRRLRTEMRDRVLSDPSDPGVRAAL